MAKKEGKSEALGISGFTLGIVSLVMVIFTPIGGALLALTGFIFCIIQQKKYPTKLGKSGLILNIAGLLVNIVWWFVLIKYLYPLVQEQMQGSFAS